MFQLDSRSTIDPMNAGLFVSPGYGTHDTRVLDSYELLFVTRGRLGMFEEEHEYVIEKNQTLILSPGKRHGGTFPYPNDLNFYWVHFRTKGTSEPHFALRVPKVTTVADAEFITELFCQFISDQEAAISDPSYFGRYLEIALAELITLMLVELGKATARPVASRKDPGVSDRQRKIADAVQRYINANFQKQISTQEIAESLGHGPDYVERAFHRVKHRPVLDAVHERQIDEARVLLRGEGRKNISEIAFACGFRDTSYFRRIFKRFTGLTARDFRALYGKTHINTH